MQLCLGATYSWSVYVGDIKALLSLSQTMAQLPFSVFYFVFPATMMVSGMIMTRIGPRNSAMLGGALFGSGWIIGSLGQTSYIFTILGNGLIAGIGAGLAYIVPIATCIKWFPNHKGLVTGVAVAGFGGGAALISKLAGNLLSDGLTPFTLFQYLGIGFLVLTICAGFWMINPPKLETSAVKRISFKEIFSSRPFLLLYFAMFTGLSAGFAINANIKELFTGSSVSAGVSAVAFFALANAAGRITWGLIFDRMESKTVIQLNLVLQALLLFMAPVILSSSFGLQLFAALTGFNYGGVLVVYAGSVARIWGAEKVATIYGWLFSSNIPGAAAPLLAAFVFDRTGSFNLPLAGIGLLILLAIFLLQVNSKAISPRSEQ